MITASRGFTSMARVAPSHDGKDMDAGGARERGEPLEHGNWKSTA